MKISRAELKTIINEELQKLTLEGEDGEFMMGFPSTESVNVISLSERSAEVTVVIPIEDGRPSVSGIENEIYNALEQKLRDQQINAAESHPAFKGYEEE